MFYLFSGIVLIFLFEWF